MFTTSCKVRLKPAADGSVDSDATEPSNSAFTLQISAEMCEKITTQKHYKHHVKQVQYSDDRQLMLVQFIILGYFNLTDLPFCCKKDAIIVFDYDFIGSFDQKQKLINHKYSEAVGI